MCPLLWQSLQSSLIRLSKENFFAKFVGTDEALLLEYATVELQELISAEVDDEKVKLYMNSLLCSIHCNGNGIKLSLVDAVFYSISIWCESKLQDYHLHFSQVNCSCNFIFIFYKVCDCLDHAAVSIWRVSIIFYLVKQFLLILLFSYLWKLMNF